MSQWFDRGRRLAVRIGGGLLDWVYPGVCHLCGDGVPGGRCLCAECADELPSLRPPFCEVCGEVFAGRIDAEFSCVNCRGQEFEFDFARPALVRSDDAMRLVRDFKYGRHLELAEPLGELAGRAFEDPRLSVALAGKWPLVPVPLYRRREKWRQFNQAAEVARVLAGRFGLPLKAALKRTRATVTQTRLTRAQRQRNLRGAFAMGRESCGTGGAILVDDVFTTGSTVNECARTLRRAGVQNVIVVTVMRG